MPHLVRRLPLLLVAALCLPSAGCVPGVAWLPDSSGFFYTEGEQFDRLCFYDVAKKERRVVVGATDAPTMWPALSPDGKRLAVAKLILTARKKTTQIQVVLYDRQGKELQRSKPLDWATLERDAPDNPKIQNDFDGAFPQLWWAPEADKILVHTGGYTGIFDVKAGKLSYATEGILLVFRGGPVRPDGAGFVVMKNFKGWMDSFNEGKQPRDGDPRFAFVGWDGKKVPIKAPALMLNRDALKNEKDTNKLMALFLPLVFDSGWDGEVAHVHYNVDRLRYFTKKGEAILDSMKQDVLDDGLAINGYAFRSGKTRLRVVMVIEPGKGPDNAKHFRLEVLKEGQKKAEVVADETQMCLLLPSPDGQMVAVYCYQPKEKKGQTKLSSIVVVDAKGAVVTDLVLQK